MTDVDVDLLTIYRDKDKARSAARSARTAMKQLPSKNVFEVDVAENATMYRILQCFMLCEADTTANSDVFELAVAQNAAIYSVFEPAVQKHRNVRHFQ